MIRLWKWSPHKEDWKWKKEHESRSVGSDSLRLHKLYNPWNYLGQNTGVGSSSFLQGIFPTQGSNPGLLYCGQILYQLSHMGSPKILEWVAYSFFSGSSQPRNWTGISCMQAGSLPAEFSALRKEIPKDLSHHFHYMKKQWKHGCFLIRKRARTRDHWCLDVGLLSIQICESKTYYS